jgi:hypothetical protein
LSSGKYFFLYLSKFDFNIFSCETVISLFKRHFYKGVYFMAINLVANVNPQQAQNIAPLSPDTLLAAIRAFSKMPLFSADRNIQRTQIDHIVQSLITGPTVNFTGTDVGKIFVQAIREGFDGFHDQILSLLQRTGPISSQGNYGLGHALNEAVKKSDFTALHLIRGQVGFAQIPAIDSTLGLNFCLLECLRILFNELRTNTYPIHTDFLQAIVLHPNARLIDDVEKLDPEFDPLRQTRAIAQQRNCIAIVSLLDEFMG